MISPAPAEECLLEFSIVQEVYLLSKYGDRSSFRDFTLFGKTHNFTQRYSAIYYFFYLNNIQNTIL